MYVIFIQNKTTNENVNELRRLLFVVDLFAAIAAICSGTIIWKNNPNHIVTDIRIHYLQQFSSTPTNTQFLNGV